MGIYTTIDPLNFDIWIYIVDSIPKSGPFGRALVLAVNIKVPWDQS